VQKKIESEGARGNITLFPLNIPDILAAMRGKVLLPHTPEGLANVVRVLLKTAPGEAARVIAQCLVRRHVVVALIEDRMRRGHPAYQHLDFDAVQKRAQQLPEDGPLVEVIHLLEADGSMDKLRPLKNATPGNAKGTVEKAFVALRSLEMAFRWRTSGVYVV